MAGPLTFAALLLYLFRPQWAFASNGGKLLFWHITPMLAAITIEPLLTRAYANWTAPIFIAASPYVAAGLLLAHRRWLLCMAIVINVLMGAGLYAYELVRAHYLLPLTEWVGVDPFKRTRPWPDFRAAILQLQMDFPGARFLFFDRAVLCECLYYGRLPRNQAFVFNPSGSPLSQYGLPTHLQPGDGLFLVTDDPPGYHNLAAVFGHHVLCMQLAIRTHRDNDYFYIYYVADFKGYL